MSPFYGYTCDDCDLQQDKYQPIGEALIAPKCNVCDQEMSRLYEATPAIFKGTGWGKQ